MGDDPYIGHLMGVAALVVEYGGTESQVCGALLHDTIEDTRMTYPQLRAAMGKRVARIVSDCTSVEDKSLEYRDRKQKYIDGLAGNAGKPSVLVALADKVHNAENTLRDVRRIRANDPTAETAFWATFNSKDVSDQKWWYESLVATFDGLPLDERGRALLERLRTTVKEIFAPHSHLG